MSYDVRFEVDGDTVYLDQPLDVRGGTYAIGGTGEAWLNITYNYSGAFRALFGEDGGIRSLYGKPASTLRGELVAAIDSLPGIALEQKPCTCHGSRSCYWAITRANVACALHNLLTLARAVPDGAVLVGD